VSSLSNPMSSASPRLPVPPWWLVPLSLLLAACAPAVEPRPAAPPHPAVPPPPATQARWYGVELADTLVGRVRERSEPLADGGFATHVTSELRIGRLGAVMEMTVDATFDEDRGGRLRAVRSRQNLSRQTTTMEVALAGGEATIRESAGGPVHTRTLALGEPLLGPAGIRRAIAAKLQRPGDTLAYRTWSLETSGPSRVQCTAVASETRAVAGAPRPVLRTTMVTDGQAHPRTVWFDAEGREVRSEVASPVGQIVTLAARSEPVIPSGPGTEVPADTFARSLLRSNVRLPRARSLDKLIVQLAFDGPAPRLPGLEAADARIVRRDAGAVVLEIDRVRVPDDRRGAAEPAVGREFLAAGLFIDPTDPQVRQIASAAIAGTTDPWERAQRLTRWVTEHMTFDAGIAFAPAVELARDRRGTCAGYAVLLASLLRAADIPARLVMGVVYVGGIFGGHAWVEAHVRGRWVPLDGAVPSGGAADAARIAFGRDALDGGPGPLFAAFGEVVGHSKLHVLGYATAGGPVVQVDASAAPYVVDGARYHNRGLGLSLEAPPGYRFTMLDAVWPDRTMLALEGPGGRVTLGEGVIWPGRDPAEAAAKALALAGPGACQRRTVAGRTACAARRDGAAGLAFADGPSLYILEARGPEAQTLLDAVARTMRIAPATQ
jgi:transglutaminase-like putative cysteine protease